MDLLLQAQRDWVDALANEYNARSKRMHCVGVLPLGVPEEAARELRRGVTELGFIGFELGLLSPALFQVRRLASPPSDGMMKTSWLP